MLPIANEAEHARHWIAQPDADSRAEWVDGYVTALGRVRPGIALADAYAAGLKSYERQSKINPRLAAACDVMLGPLN